MSTDVRLAIAADFREPLADQFAETAAWRRRKAEDWPDDPRNDRAASALEAAAKWARNADPSEFRIFADFELEFDGWDTKTMRPLEYLRESGGNVNAATVGRFFFDYRPGEPTEHDFRTLLLDAHTDMLESWRDTLRAINDQPPGGLVKYFEDCGVPLYDEDENDE